MVEEEAALSPLTPNNPYIGIDRTFAPTWDQCSLCDQYNQIEITRPGPAWGRRLCAKCAVISNLVTAGQELPDEMVPGFVQSIGALAETWQNLTTMWRHMIAELWTAVQPPQEQ